VKKWIIGLITLAMLALPVVAASDATTMLLTDLVERQSNKGSGAVTWNNATGITVLYSSAYAATSTLAVSTAEVFTTASSYGAEQDMLYAVMAASGSATVAWASDVFTIDCANGPSGYSTQETADCSTGTGLSIAACDALIQALNCVGVTGDVTVTWATKFQAAGYQSYGNAEMGKEAAGAVATAGTTVTISADAATLHDSALLDCTNKSIDQCETLFESMWEGDVNTWTTVDGMNSDLANGFNDVANLGAASYASALAIPMTAGGAAIDYLEEDRYDVISACDVFGNSATTITVKIFDGSTQIRELAALPDDTWTTYTFDPPLAATGSNKLTVQLYSSGTIATVTKMYCVGTLNQ